MQGKAQGLWGFLRTAGMAVGGYVLCLGISLALVVSNHGITQFIGLLGLLASGLVPSWLLLRYALRVAGVDKAA